MDRQGKRGRVPGILRVRRRLFPGKFLTVAHMHRSCAVESMKNITRKIDDEANRKARTLAARRGTSVSGMVREFLVSLETEEGNRETRRIAALEELSRLADQRAKTAQAGVRSRASVTPLTREEIPADRIR